MHIFNTYNSFLHQRMLESLEVTSSDLFASLLLGIDLPRGGEYMQKIKVTGMLYFFVISGMHMSQLFHLVSTSCTTFFRKKQLALWCGGIVVVLYAAVIGFSIPIIRTVVMLWYGLLARLLKRTTSKRMVFLYLVVIYVVISVSSPVVVVASPSFLLSYGAVFALMFLPATPHISTAQNLWTAIQASLRVNVCIAPLLLYFFGEWNPLGIFFSVFFAPLISVFVTLGFLFLVWESFSAVVFSSFQLGSLVFASVFTTLLWPFDALLSFCAQHSRVLRAKPSPLVLVVYYLILAVSIAVMRWHHKRKQNEICFV